MSRVLRHIGATNKQSDGLTSSEEAPGTRDLRNLQAAREEVMDIVNEAGWGYKHRFEIRVTNDGLGAEENRASQ